jgi:tripartite-type tricarboxylate transporter receptor subunit TctC
MPRVAAFVLAVAATLAAPLDACAQAWPQRPVRIVVPYPPGGPSDIVLRAAAGRMQAALDGEPIVLDNKPGAGGNVGTAEVARAAADGYTWVWVPDSVFTVNPHVYRNLGFSPDDFVPVTVATEFSQTLVCHPGVGVKTVPELMAKAKTQSLSYASGGYGVPGHLAMEMLLADAGVKMQHVPYKGPAPAAQDVMGGQVACGFLAGPTVLPHVRSGRLVALAVSGAKRSLALPEVPTVAESGYPGYDATFFLALFARKGTPAAIVAKMHDALVDALRSPEVTETLRLTDQALVADTPEHAAARVASTARTWGAVVKRIDLHLD